ncbi:MAG: 16S rRNA (uracil(1498)-N(3))-methyltransferase [Deltaproteobacteria bacterium]|nr:16S rRNA (uracil(1498)-N(3))-methyltransferase [Deltaproteobacteria bacterium]
MHPHRSPRFFIEDINPDKQNIIITGEQFHHLKNVLRLNVGEEISVFDGKGNDFLAELKTIGKREALASIKQRLVPAGEKGFKTVLAQGIAKGEKMDMIIQKATELGAASIIPFTTARTVPRLKDDKEGKKIERWQKISIEAAKQCERSIVPKIEPVKSYDEMLSGWDKYLKIILWEYANDLLLKEILNTIKGSNYPGIIVVVGPEGGLSEEEILLAERHGFLPVRLFSNILRTETAAIAILSIIKYELGLR